MLVAAVLDAPVQVLERDGAARLTAPQVVGRAGVGAGALDLPLPDETAVLFRLQNERWRRSPARARRA